MKTAGRQLVQAEKMSSLGQMVSGIAHDINNPLGYIASNRENLQKKSHEIRDFLFKLMGDAPEAKTTKDHLNSEFKSLDDGFTSIGRGSKILKGISSALRNYGRTDLDNKEACDLKEILENVATILNSKLKHLEFKSDFEGERIIKCRPSNLSQIFLNLISNACDALAEEEVENPTILFSSKRLNSGQEEILIKVEDNGPGIPDNIKNKILDAFFTTKAVGKGTGLGLSITNKIIQEHNGKITVKDSESLGGACFEIHLPIK